MLEKISKALHINSMYLNMDDHTEALDFVFTLLDWDRTTDFIIKKETIDNENHYLIDLNTNLFDDFLEAWIQSVLYKALLFMLSLFKFDSLYFQIIYVYYVLILESL